MLKIFLKKWPAFAQLQKVQHMKQKSGKIFYHDMGGLKFEIFIVTKKRDGSRREMIPVKT